MTTPAAHNGTVADRLAADRGADLSRAIGIARATHRCVAVYGHIDDLLPTATGSFLRLPEQIAIAGSGAGIATVVASEADGLQPRTPPGARPVPDSVRAGPAPLSELLDRALLVLREIGGSATLLLRNAHAVAERDDLFGERLRELPFDHHIANSGIQVVVTFRESATPTSLQGATGWDLRHIPLPGLGERRAAVEHWAKLGVVDPTTIDLAEFATLTGGLELDEVRRLLAEHADFEHLTPRRVSEVRSSALKRQLGNMLHVNHHPDVSFDDVVGGDAVKAAVRLARSEDRYSPIALVGPPGVGKTMLATAAARELGLPIVYVDGQLKGGIVGDTARNLAKFRELLVAYAPVVAFWDEIDLLIGRSTDYNGDSGAANEVRQSVLTLMQDAASLRVLIIASCNNPMSALQFRVRNRLRLIPVLHPVGSEVLAIARLEAKKIGVKLSDDAAELFESDDGVLWNGRDIAKVLESAKSNAKLDAGPRALADPIVLTAQDLQLLVRYTGSAADAAAELNALEAVYVTDNPSNLPWIARRSSGKSAQVVPRYLKDVVGPDGIPDRQQIAAKLAAAGVHDAR